MRVFYLHALPSLSTTIQSYVLVQGGQYAHVSITRSYHVARTYLKNYGALSIRYKCGMIRLTNEQWERIRKHFPEEHIPDWGPGRKPVRRRRWFERVLWFSI